MSMMMIRNSVKIIEVCVIDQYEYEFFFSNQSMASLSDGHKMFLGSEKISQRLTSFWTHLQIYIGKVRLRLSILSPKHVDTNCGKSHKLFFTFFPESLLTTSCGMLSKTRCHSFRNPIARQGRSIESVSWAPRDRRSVGRHA